jgi:hypothetical protein
VCQQREKKGKKKKERTKVQSNNIRMEGEVVILKVLVASG